MTNNEIVRSWKDDDYRLGLHSGELAFMPGNPAGLIELGDNELLEVDGGVTPTVVILTAYISAAATVGSAIGVVSYFHCR
jgi:mersacidin/lichenicidin family type 2 lantibiotic